MRYTIYKLSFPNGIHIGTGNLSSTEKVIHSDTLFSAMCIEALNMGGEEELNRFVQMAKDNQLRNAVYRRYNVFAETDDKD